MKLIIYLFLGQIVLLWNECNFISGNPLLGEHVRAAGEGEYRGVVSIQKYPLSQENNAPVEDHWCTGTLISREDVLTADHCFDVGDQLFAYRVGVGSVDLTAGTLYYPSWWLSYLTYAARTGTRVRYLNNDIAIIRLTRQVPSGMRFSTLNYVKLSSVYDKYAHMAGWGKFPNGTTNRFLQSGRVSILSKTSCENKLAELRGAESPIEAIMLCSVGRPYLILSKGDSGGPLFYHNNIIAVNKALAPDIERVNRTQRLNMHIGVGFYKTFIQYVQLEC